MAADRNATYSDLQFKQCASPREATTVESSDGPKRLKNMHLIYKVLDCRPRHCNSTATLAISANDCHCHSYNDNNGGDNVRRRNDN